MSEPPAHPDAWRGEIRRRLEALRLPPLREAEIIEEVAQHLDDRYRELQAAGHAPDAAARVAWREIEGGDVLSREIARVETPAPLELAPPGAPARGRWLGALWQDATGAPEPFVYYPLGQYHHFGRGTFMVKSSLPVSRVAQAATAIAARTDSRVPFYAPHSLTADVNRGLSDQRLFACVLSLLAALGFLLASLGLYGLVAQTVTERAREFGIRVALGAGRAAIIRIVARYALVVSLSGILVGVTLSFAGTRLLQTLLYGVTRLDATIYAAASFTLVAAVALACVGPVMRALRVQPVDVLRSE